MKSSAPRLAAAFWLIGAVAAFAGEASPPPPASAYTQPAAIADVAVSPDGTRLALIARDGAREGAKPIIRVLTRDNVREIGAGGLDVRGVGWLDATHLLVRDSTIIDANPVMPRQRVSQGVSFDLATGKSTTLLDGMENVAPMLTDSWIEHGVYKARAVVFVRGLSAGPAFALYRIDVATGRAAALTPPSLDAEHWLVGPAGELRATRVSQSNGRGSVTKVKTEAGWRVLADDGTLTLPGLTRDGTQVIAERDGASFVVSGKDGTLSPLEAPAGRTVATLVFDDALRLRGERLGGLAPEYAFSDPVLAAGWPKLKRAFPNAQVEFLDASADGYSVALSVTGAQDAGAVYWADLRTLRAEKVGDLRPALSAARLGRTSAIELRARDGLALPSVLTLPPAGDARALPLVVLLGGDPNATATLGFSAVAQAFAARGYAVLQVNTRGSALTPALEAAGVGQLGGAMQTDISDAVADLVRRGVADAQRVCVVGDDYGGYAALASVTLRQDGYRCAVAVQPAVDLAEAVRWPDPYLRGGPQQRAQTWRRMTGADAPDAGRRLAAASPLRAAARADAPVLLIADSLHPERGNEARRMREALRAAAKPVEFVQLDAKTGDLSSPEGQAATLTAMLDFVGRKNPA